MCSAPGKSGRVVARVVAGLAICPLASAGRAGKEKPAAAVQCLPLFFRISAALCLYYFFCAFWLRSAVWGSGFPEKANCYQFALLASIQKVAIKIISLDCEPLPVCFPVGKFDSEHRTFTFTNYETHKTHENPNMATGAPWYPRAVKGMSGALPLMPCQCGTECSVLHTWIRRGACPLLSAPPPLDIIRELKDVHGAVKEDVHVSISTYNTYNTYTILHPRFLAYLCGFSQSGFAKSSLLTCKKFAIDVQKVRYKKSKSSLLGVAVQKFAVLTGYFSCLTPFSRTPKVCFVSSS